MRLPTFLIAGAAKSGTTLLYDQLQRHPDVYMAPEKEPAYFSRHWSKGLEWYAGHFAGCSVEHAVGEATVDYMVDPLAPGRIRQVLPDARFVFILREPVSRAWSHYWHQRKMGEEGRSFGRILDEEGPAAFPIHYGRYHEHLARYLAEFPRERFLLLVLEEVVEAPEASFGQLYRHLGVSEAPPPASVEASNVSAAPRSERLSRASAAIRRMDRLKRALPAPLFRGARAVFRELNRRNLRRWDYPPLPDEQRARLEAALAETVEETERLLGRPIPAWRGPPPAGPRP